MGWDTRAKAVSPLRDAVLEAFRPGGPVAASDPAFRRRQAQLDLALAVADAIAERSTLVAEAGTGIGKTFAYLVPALLSGARVLVSTATKTLQDQLFGRDLPRLAGALGVPVSLALLKGRSSYLCVHRLEAARSSATLPDRAAVAHLASIERWAAGTPSGDLSEVAGLDERSPVIPLVTSTRDNCLGGDCPRYRDCHLMKARREAMAADVVVVNHHLFFADLALRDTSVAELLPTVDLLVFDEAHQLNETGIAFSGRQLGSLQGQDLARDLLACGLQRARGLQAWPDLAGAIDRGTRDLRLACGGRAAAESAAVPGRAMRRLRWRDAAERAGFAEALSRLSATLVAAAEALDTVSELAPDFPRLAQRCRDLHALAQAFTEPCPPDRVRWVDVGAAQVRLVESALDVAPMLAAARARVQAAWVFTSATLGDDERLGWFTGPAGLADATILRLGSPFDYARQARLWLPRDLPPPSDSRHPVAVAACAAQVAEALGGRTFVLTTTLRALGVIADELETRLAGSEPPMEVLVQGRRPKRELLRRFVEHSRAVLVGSQSFWEGVDLRGDDLQCVVIDKLPFPPPDDPLVEARSNRLRREGREPFRDLHLAEAAVSLKQGAGRLIRSETDEGLLVVCDPRLRTMGYGRRLLAALPPMSRLDEPDEVMEYLRGLQAGQPPD
jgi:ATP-dependent DNA helicase DinG